MAFEIGQNKNAPELIRGVFHWWSGSLVTGRRSSEEGDSPNVDLEIEASLFWAGSWIIPGFSDALRH